MDKVAVCSLIFNKMNICINGSLLPGYEETRVVDILLENSETDAIVRIYEYSEYYIVFLPI